MRNREYKSDVFSMLLSEKENALEVYNALNGSQYDNPELVEYQMLRKGVSLTIRNDASFILDGGLELYEHQSTVCKNMPLRFLFYISNILEDLTKDKNIFGYTEILIPEPKFVVFYNGEQNQPEKKEF